jgi:SAM-dependent methyltransferase
VRYEIVDLPELPYPEGYFDVAVAFEVAENLERPEDLVVEAKRVLKPDGVLIISTPDKQTHSNERNYRDQAHKRELYRPEFRELLEQHFEHVSMYRQEAVAGSLILKDAERLPRVSAESTRFFSAESSFSTEPPATQFVIAVCSNSEVSGKENEQPYLLLDRDHRIFDECEDHREEAQLLLDEIQYIQETGAQAFREAIKLHNSEVAHLRSQLEHSEERGQQLKNRLHAVEAAHLRMQLERSEERTQGLRNRAQAAE